MRSLLNHQKEGVDFLSDKYGAGLFFEMRLGKTITSLEHLHNLNQKEKNPWPCLIVAPLSVIPVWSEEIKKFGYDFKVAELTGSRLKRLESLNSDAQIYIINYEGLKIIFPHLVNKKFTSIILDESHRAKSVKAIQTRAILQLSRTAKYKYILSGTPITKSPEDIWSQLEFISPNLLGNFYSFSSKYIEMKRRSVKTKRGYRDIMLPYRFKNLKELEQIISTVCLRKTQSECIDLPEKSYKKIYCQLEGDQMQAYAEMFYSLKLQFKDEQFSAKNALTQIQKLKQICHGFIYDENTRSILFKNNSKLEMLSDLLEDIQPEYSEFYAIGDPQKTVLFCDFQADIEILSEFLEEKKYTFILYPQDPSLRQDAIKRFNEIKSPCIFLSTIETGKEGINLSVASQMIFYGRNWNYASRYQAEARIQSAFNKRNLMYYDIIAKDTVDERVTELLFLKAETADKILGDSKRLAKLLIQEKPCKIS